MSEYRDQLIAREQRIADLEEEVAAKDRKLAELAEPPPQPNPRRFYTLMWVSAAVTVAIAVIGALLLTMRTHDAVEVTVSPAPVEVRVEPSATEGDPTRAPTDLPTKAFYREKLMPMGGVQVSLSRCSGCSCCEGDKPPSTPDAACSACIVRELFEANEMATLGLGGLETWMASPGGHTEYQYAGVKLDGEATIFLEEPAQHVGIYFRRTGDWRTWSPDDVQLSMTAYDRDGNELGVASTTDPVFTDDNAVVGRNHVFVGLYSKGIVNIRRVEVTAAPNDVVIERVRAYIPGWSRRGPNKLDDQPVPRFRATAGATPTPRHSSDGGGYKVNLPVGPPKTD